ncbi:hypothetical protein HII36_38625 [Nonomuraea sp. NN258]|uniref:hypothetical protein n=1 Tax=Nonomuraea antri TaxID=2730852 RepID=UPI0015690079|nr:hypothetical protein [Nonomuraea antri]NRQ37704.1 hypothetical protein [Nonomuraea antri]
MSEAFAAAIRERVRLAESALRAARRDGDAHGAILAEGEWEHLIRLARTHGVDVTLDPQDAAPEEPGRGEGVGR